LEGGRLNLKPLLTHRFNWRKTSEAYQLLATGDLNAQGILLDWSDE
jgi:hypothetical protein